MSLYQQEIAAAGDVALLVYREDTSHDEISREGLASAMKQGIKDKTMKLITKLGKLTAVANPALGDEFLQEVRLSLCFCGQSVISFIALAN